MGPSTARVNRDWIRACVVGELVGFVPPALTGATLATLGASDTVLVPALVAAGIMEGVILGWAQRRVIRQQLPGITGWVTATAVAAGLAWLAGMGGSALVQSVGAVGLLVAGPGWMVGLVSMGALQWHRLRLVVPDAGAWIPATTLSWLVGVSIPVVALSIVPDGWAAPVHVLVAIAAAVAMGATVGAITGRTLDRLAGSFSGAGRGPRRG